MAEFFFFEKVYPCRGTQHAQNVDRGTFEPYAFREVVKGLLWQLLRTSRYLFFFDFFFLNVFVFFPF
jgi:hypothetical protein